MANNNDLFGMHQAKDKLDGTNHPMWSYIMKHVLVAKQLWNIVVDVDWRPTGPTSQYRLFFKHNGFTYTYTSNLDGMEKMLKLMH